MHTSRKGLMQSVISQVVAHKHNLSWVYISYCSLGTYFSEINQRETNNANDTYNSTPPVVFLRPKQFEKYKENITVAGSVPPVMHVARIQSEYSWAFIDKTRGN